MTVFLESTAWIMKVKGGVIFAWRVNEDVKEEKRRVSRARPRHAFLVMLFVWENWGVWGDAGF